MGRLDAIARLQKILVDAHVGEFSCGEAATDGISAPLRQKTGERAKKLPQAKELVSPGGLASRDLAALQLSNQLRAMFSLHVLIQS